MNIGFHKTVDKTVVSKMDVVTYSYKRLGLDLIKTDSYYTLLLCMYVCMYVYTIMYVYILEYVYMYILGVVKKNPLFFHLISCKNNGLNSLFY